jgi:hypothetical protein
MTKWLKWCCGGCLVTLALAAVAAIFAWSWVRALPREWTSEAQVEIAAPASEVLPLVEDLHRWKEWSAWNRDIDADVSRTFAGPERGVGARMEWTSEDTAGDGRIELRTATSSSVEYESWHLGGLVISGREKGEYAARTASVVLRDDDHDYVVPGSFTIEPTERGARVTWRETMDLGESVLAKFYAISIAPIARQAHQRLLEASLEGLKDRVELR